MIEEEEDRELDELLSRLGKVECDPGFEERVMRRAQSRHRDFMRPGSRHGLAWAIGLALVATAIATFRLPSRIQPQTIRPVAQSRSGTSFGVRGTVQSVAIRDRIPAHRRLAMPTLVAPLEQEAAMAEQLGFPAPPMPLTDQERMLVRIAGRGEPNEFITLDVAMQDALEAMRDREYRKFFEDQQPLPATDEGTTTKQTGDGQ